jgi:hypothetical protein
MARSFLGLLFDSKPKDSHILIWTKENAQKRSAWYQNIETATKYAHKVGSKADTYFGIGLASQPLESYQRVPANEVAGLPGLWLDIDYKTPGVHKKSNLPIDEKEALWLIEQMPLEPSILVHSGHGFQAYWLFPEVIKLESGEQRIYLSDLSERWQYYGKAVAATKGWDVDSTFDLARVFRVPETFNLKDKDKPIKVTLRGVTDERYTVDKIEAVLERQSVAVGAPLADVSDKRSDKRKLADEVTFKLDPDAQPPKAKFNALYSNEPKFAASWEHQRTDFKDDSPSSYDCSLATFAYHAGWNDQDIVSLLIAHRRKYNFDLKIDRKPHGDYYRRTLAEAKYTGDIPSNKKSAKPKKITSTDKSEVREKKTAREIKEDEAPPEEEASDNKESNLAVVSDALQVDVVRIVKYLSDPPQYVICLGSGREIEVKPMVLMSQQAMRTTMAIAVNKRIPKIKPKMWDHLSDCMFAALDEVEPSDETTHLGAIAHYLYKFLKLNYRPEQIEQHDRALRDQPAKLAGKCCFDLDALLRFVSTEFSQRLDKATVTQRLMRLGCVYEKRSLRKGEQVTSRKFWVVPDEFISNRQLLVNTEKSILEDEREEERMSVN